MAPKKKVLRQYGSHKRLTPAERLFNLQYRMQTKGGKHTTGDVPSDEFRAVHASLPKQQRAVTPFPPPHSEDRISLPGPTDRSVDEMLLDTTVNFGSWCGVDTRKPNVMAPSLPNFQFDNLIGLENAAEGEIVTTKERVQEPQIAHDQTTKLGDKPFRFMGLVPEIRNQILQVVLRRSDSIIPYYNYCSVELPEHMAVNENVDTSVLQVNKQIYEEASHVLYTENTFVFEAPEVALWWLKRIGPSVARIRTAGFVLDSGEVSQAFGAVKEQLWRILFAWLKPRHHIQHFIISFRKWHQNHELRRERERVMLILLEYRGIEHVTIKRSNYIDKTGADFIERCMMLKEGETFQELEDLINSGPVEPAYVF